MITLWKGKNPIYFGVITIIPFDNLYKTSIFCDAHISCYPMSYDNLSSVSQNVLKFYQQLSGEERRVPFIFGRNNH